MQSQIDPLVTFRNSQCEAVRGTIVNLQRKSLAMEVFSPYSVVRVSEVLDELTIHFDSSVAYRGRAVIVSLVNTGPTAVVSATLIDGWRDLDNIAPVPGAVGEAAKAFIDEWGERNHILPGYQLAGNEPHAFLADVSRWMEQVGVSETLPKEPDGRLREDVLHELVAHRNRIDLLADFLARIADATMHAGQIFRILAVGCGPAAEIQHFVRSYPRPESLSFERVDFSQKTLDWTSTTLSAITAQRGAVVLINYVHDSVHNLLKRGADSRSGHPERFRAVYCAGLFDYLSDKVCARLAAHFAARTHPGGGILITNMHSQNPMKLVMEHVLEWYLAYRDNEDLAALLPSKMALPRIYRDATGGNIFAEAIAA